MKDILMWIEELINNRAIFFIVQVLMTLNFKDI